MKKQEGIVSIMTYVKFQQAFLKNWNFEKFMEKTLTFLQNIKFVVSFSLNVSVHDFFGASFHDHRLSLIARRYLGSDER